jgi:hypothetical protein
VLGYDATPTPTAVELYKLLDDTGAEVTFAPFAMTVDGDGVFWGTLDGDCVPLAAEGETWSLIWETTLAGYADPIYDRQTQLVGFENVSDALCTLTDVYPLAGVSSDANGALAKIILAASRAIRAHTGLTFGSVVTEERVVRVDGDPTAYPRELRSLTSVEDANGSTVAAEAAEADMNGHVRWLELPYRMSGLLTVTGEWGWDEIPADVVLYAAQTVADWFKRDQAITQNAIGEIGFDGVRRTRLLPPYVAEGLAVYRR